MNADPEPLDYEQMLGALQGLLHRQIEVQVHQAVEDRTYPVAALHGELSHADVTEPDEERVRDAGMHGGEWIGFSVGDSSFYLTRNGYANGLRKRQSLEWATGDALTIVLTDPVTDLRPARP